MRAEPRYDLAGILALSLGLFHLLNVSGLLVFSTMVVRIVHLSGIFCLAFFAKDLKHKIIAGLAALGGLVMLARWEAIARSGDIAQLDFIVGIALILLVLYASLAVVGRALAGITLLFLVYPFVCQYMPGIFYSRGFSAERIFNFLVHTSQGIYGIPIGVAATYIILFTIYGAFLNRFGAGDFFYGLAKTVTRNLTAASAKAAVLFSTMLGMISGSAAGNVAVTGSVTIPMMKKEGYRPAQAASIEAVVSTGGQVMPPVMGAAAFIMAEIIGQPYVNIMKAALIPALLFFVSILFVVHLQARKLQIGSAAAPAEQDGKSAAFLPVGLPLIASFATLIALMILGYSPFKACFWALILLLGIKLAFSVKQLKLFMNECILAVQQGVRSAIPVSIACAAAGIIAGILAVTGLGSKLSYLIEAMSAGILILALLLTAVMAIVLGMGLPTTAAYLILATVIAPGLADMGVPLLTAHLFVFFYGCISTITPPVALASYVAAGLAEADVNEVGWTAFRYGLVCYLLPFMFLFGPALLGQGTAFEIALSAVSAVLGVFCIAAAVVGYLQASLGMAARLPILIAGISLIHQGLITDLIGAMLMAALLFLAQRRTSGALRE